jgi:hypothetical protein
MSCLRSRNCNAHDLQSPKEFMMGIVRREGEATEHTSTMKLMVLLQADLGASVFSFLTKQLTDQRARA